MTGERKVATRKARGYNSALTRQTLGKHSIATLLYDHYQKTSNLIDSALGG